MKTELREKIMDVALDHIAKVNAEPDIEMENQDAYDAWIRLNDDWEVNIHEGNFGFKNPSTMSRKEKDSSKFEWYCSAYPVEIDGAMVSKATLHNMAYIEGLSLEIGCRVEVIRSGEIIPRIVRRVW